MSPNLSTEFRSSPPLVCTRRQVLPWSVADGKNTSRRRLCASPSRCSPLTQERYLQHLPGFPNYGKHISSRTKENLMRMKVGVKFVFVYIRVYVPQGNKGSLYPA